ncbi:uracil-xanthine permease family protein [Tenuibacillus multivorans]|uniref:Uracil permease n=1 Tax=Tenuibacillus multivorans TaxID=237069 RepID=A0A1G9Y5R1_9BACI|nr:solute carrier family 23 protein [Tenuibacillus multivorans]GEL75947.1 uracil permease [Tenuibacillus multivorans]SDN03986.1 uracil permease [Tenuibacillus multivorans]
MNNNEKVLDIRDVPKWNQWLVLSLQHLFAMFGATILVPFLTDMPPSVALVTSGLGTIAYLIITRGQIPAYLGSSFAFIYPITLASQVESLEGAMVGAFLVGVVYGIVSLLIKWIGVNWLLHILPPVVVGPVIMVIGLGLAPTAIDMAMNDVDGNYNLTFISVALVTLLITIVASVFFKGFWKIIPILLGIVGGYLYALFCGVVDTEPIKASWNEVVNANSFGELMTAIFTKPDFIIPFVDFSPFDVLSLSVVGIMVPVALVTITEHIGDQMVLSKVTGQNFIKKPGLHRSILGDGLATLIASVLGGPPNTTYGENIGVLAITRVFSIFVIGGAAILAIFFGFIDIIAVLIESVPQPVMGGVSILLFGIIASSGLRMLIDNNVDLGNNRNLIISSVILVIGIGGMYLEFQIGEFDLQIAGMALSAIIGILLNLILPGREQAKGSDNMFDAEQKAS